MVDSTGPIAPRIAVNVSPIIRSHEKPARQTQTTQCIARSNCLRARCLVNALVADTSLISGNLHPARKFSLAANPALDSNLPLKVDRYTVREVVMLAHIDGLCARIQTT
jgi:hypothetical protein